MAYQSINPNDGKVLKSFEHLTGSWRSLLRARSSVTRPGSTGVTRIAPQS